MAVFYPYCGGKRNGTPGGKEPENFVVLVFFLPATPRPAPLRYVITSVRHENSKQVVKLGKNRIWAAKFGQNYVNSDLTWNRVRKISTLFYFKGHLHNYMFPTHLTIASRAPPLRYDLHPTTRLYSWHRGSMRVCVCVCKHIFRDTPTSRML